MTHINPLPVKEYRIILSILFIELCIYYFCDIKITSFRKNTFIAFEQDPLLWLVYLTGLPQYILANSFVSYFIDLAIFFLLGFLIWKPFEKWITVSLLILLFIFYCIFTAHLAHRNYQLGYLFVLLPFLFTNLKNRQIVFEMTRYFLLFFYVSAAYFKIHSGSLFIPDHFSHAVINQFTPYFLEQSFSIRTDFNLYLIAHPHFAQALYIIAAASELMMLIGFFTKKFDRQLTIIILAFHFSNWFIMDIAPIGQLAFIFTLFYSDKFAWKMSKSST